MHQVIKGITRQRVIRTEWGEKVEESTIDHLYTNSQIGYELVEHFASDHVIVKTNLTTDHIPVTKKLVRRDWRSYNDQNILKFNQRQGKKLLETINRNLTSENVGTLLNSINEYHTGILNQLAPYRVSKLEETLTSLIVN